jgi:hypothetical protein
VYSWIIFIIILKINWKFVYIELMAR